MHQAPLGIVIRTDLSNTYISFGLEVSLEEGLGELVLCGSALNQSGQPQGDCPYSYRHIFPRKSPSLHYSGEVNFAQFVEEAIVET